MKKQTVISTSILFLSIIVVGFIISFTFNSNPTEAATIKDTLSQGCRNECIDGYRETSWDDGYYVHPYAYCHVYCPDEAE